MSKTQAELIDKAFRIATGLDPFQDPGVEEIAPLKAIIPPLFEQLAADNICVVQDPNDIPDAWFLPLARLLANTCAPDLSGAAMDEAAKQTDEETLRRLTKPANGRRTINANDMQMGLIRRWYY